ncbi:conserved exported hypothetical protein [Hyphomicrobiales bacterium]|nr:conserved exported hypothetical protein [Hyphomicrobiales bacterium]CAH1700928.1 conserved exported hypothetical protein [Hyphomicrobiales bacterium]CAI0344803.1 conserved exported hypothetical protein [Hyphomicrobiales bacterium]
MVRTTLLAAAVAGLLGGVGSMALPAAAAPVAAPGGQMARSGQELAERVQYYGPRPYYRPRPAYRPHCFWSERRVWNGWRWVVRPVRVCR